MEFRPTWQVLWGLGEAEVGWGLGKVELSGWLGRASDLSFCHLQPWWLLGLSKMILSFVHSINYTVWD